MLLTKIKMTKFRDYWRDLKLNHPEKYAERLKKNRERIRAYREQIYADKALHESYKESNREASKRRYQQRKEQRFTQRLADKKV